MPTRQKCDASPGRIFLVGPSHTFERFAAAFARWDLSHLHNFERKDGRLIGYPDDAFGPDLVWLDHSRLTRHIGYRVWFPARDRALRATDGRRGRPDAARPAPVGRGLAGTARHRR